MFLQKVFNKVVAAFCVFIVNVKMFAWFVGV